MLQPHLITLYLGVTILVGGLDSCCVEIRVYNYIAQP